MKENDVIMKLVVAPTVAVKHDIRRNLPWIIWLFVFTVIYALVSSAVIRLFENNWSFLHAGYFTIINMTTVGFGDVVPHTYGGKLIAGINSFVGPLLFGIFLAVITMALQPSGSSTTLGSSDSSNPSKHPKRIANDLAENSVADFLDSLATLLRANDKQEKIISPEGRIRVKIMSDGHASTCIHMFIDIRVDKADNH